jgi:SP family arabinose:H+ symporter-like MFS transporter
MVRFNTQSTYLLVAGIIAGSGGLIFGYDVGIISGAMFQLNDRFNLTADQEGLVVALLSIGSLCGCLFAGYISDKIGRWRTIQVQNVIFTLGFFVLSFAQNVPSLYVGRLILGCASAFSAVADVPYLMEISPIVYRGRMASMYEVMVVLGALLSSLTSLGLWDYNNGWRIMFLLPIIFAGLQSAGLFLLPESPKWLFEKNRKEEAKKALTEIYCGNTSDVDEAMRDLEKLNAESNLQGLSYDKLFTKFLLPLAIIVILMALGQLTGSVVVRNYAPTIFRSAGIGQLKSLQLNTVISVINFVVVVVATSVVDLFGRIYVLGAGFIIAGIGMLILALGFLASEHDVVVFLFGAAFTSAGFNMGFGPVGWIMSSELFPTKIRGRSLSISILARNTFEFVTNYLFLGIVAGIGASGTFFIFFIFCMLSLLFTIFGLVETRGLEPNEILAQLGHRSMWRVPVECLCGPSKEESAFLMNSMGSGVGSNGDSSHGFHDGGKASAL